jgi:alpha-L-fucosidase
MSDFMRISGEDIYGSRPWEIYGEKPTKTLVTKDVRFNEKNLKFSADDIRFTTKCLRFRCAC